MKTRRVKIKRKTQRGGHIKYEMISGQHLQQNKIGDPVSSEVREYSSAEASLANLAPTILGDVSDEEFTSGLKK